MPFTSAFHKCLLLFLLGYCLPASAQFFPGKNEHLNFTSVCFEFPWIRKAASYELKLINEQTGKLASYRSLANKIIVDGLQFGVSYKWSVAGKDKKNKAISISAPIRFSIDPHVQEDAVHFRKITNRLMERGTELLIFDYAKLAVNRDLETVWYLPTLPFMHKSSGLRDLKLTADGTFLAIIDSNAYELSLTGKVLWKAPNDGKVSGDRGEDYHHDLRKLPSGNYMVLGNEFVKRRFPGETDSVKFQAGTIIEYSPEGKVLWEWHAADFFTNELLMLRRKPDGKVETATHLNAFSVNGNTIHAGFRDAGWVLKIDKLSKKVLEIYGGKDSGLANHYGQGLFSFQHDVSVLRYGSIAVVNNDFVKDPKVVSSLVIFSQGEDNLNKGEERFRFPFNYDSLTNGKSAKFGNVNELRNGNYLVNMGAINRVFEVTPLGEVVWDIFVERPDTLKKAWRPFPHYRVATASSLYPNKFSAKWEVRPISDDVVLRGEMTVFNVGSEASSYSIFIEQADGSHKPVGTVPLTRPGRSGIGSVAIPRVLLNRDTQTTVIVKANGKSTFEKVAIELF